MGGAAELFTRHVFLDLETTGLDPRADEVIELGALFIENVAHRGSSITDHRHTA